MARNARLLEPVGLVSKTPEAGVSLTCGKRGRPERPAAIAQLHVAMHPRVLSQVPHDHRAVRGSRKQQEGLDGAQAAARDLETHRKLCSPTHQPGARKHVALRTENLKHVKKPLKHP